MQRLGNRALPGVIATVMAGTTRSLVYLAVVDPLPGCYIHKQTAHVTYYRCP